MKLRALVFLVLLAPSVAAEPESLSTSLTGEAKAFYEIGRARFSDGDVAAALAKFQRAHELSQDPRLLWNVAACEAALKHYARAMSLVDRYLAGAASMISERDREQAARFRAAAKPYVAVVSLDAQPGEVAVSVDGENVGTTPLAGPLYLDAGQRRVHFTKPGFRGVVRVENVAGGDEPRWAIALERLKIRPL